MKKTRKQPQEQPCEREYDFALILEGVADLTDDVMNKLFDAGCDDATFSMRYGQVFAEFSRIAPSFENAVLSAFRGVHKAGIGAEVFRVNACDLVTAADIARRIGRSRELISKYIQGDRGPGDFPPPECYLADDKPLWAWCAVSYWLAQNQLIRPEVSREADFVDLVNDRLALTRHQRRNPEMVRRVDQHLGSEESLRAPSIKTSNSR